MRLHHQHLLTEAIYDAAVDPSSWPDVMNMLKENFSTAAETFYFLNFADTSMRAIHVAGIAERYVQCFTDRYFTPDNPWVLAKPLHKPGIVRTDERIAAFFRDPQILRRSQYFNDWMRPQNLHHSLGTTLLAESGMIANLTLLRPADIGAYSAAEIRAFTRACAHLRRAVGIATRIDAASTRRAISAEALDRLPHGIFFLDLHGRLLACNAAGEALLREQRALTLRHGRLVAVEPREDRKLKSFVARIVLDDPSDTAPVAIALDDGADAQALGLRGVRLSPLRSAFVADGPTIMIIASSRTQPPVADPTALRDRYRLTGSEIRLVQQLLTGCSLKDAAAAAGMTYETARWYLKILFEKTATHRQAELVARLLGDLSLPVSGGARRRAPEFLS